LPETSVICVLPVKNESWILKQFIEAALAWADIIIIGDHNSTDGSASIARQYDRVKVIPLRNPSFDAGARRKTLLDEARKIPGKRLIFVIDADEMLSANSVDSLEWELMLNAEPGTSFQFDSPYLLPGLEYAYIIALEGAFIDDGSQYSGSIIDEPRKPVTTGPKIQLTDIKVLHYQHIDPQRLLSRHQFYKCVEIIERGTRPWAACIGYQETDIKSYGLPIIPVDQAWLKGYDWLDEFKLKKEGNESTHWWDEEVLNYFDSYGTGRFRKINIWDVDWNKKAQLLGRKGDYCDPRSRYEIWVHKFIKKYWSELKTGQARENYFFWLAYMLGRVGLRALGW
jgi:glycosyltransferase involved in cell wall biosynthesis